MDSEAEMKGYSDFIKRFMLKLWIGVFGIGALVWVFDVFACYEIEKPMEPIKMEGVR